MRVMTVMAMPRGMNRRRDIGTSFGMADATVVLD
jgi:hypothetical protein